MKTLARIWNEKRDALISALIGVAALALYARTLAPSVAFIFDDTLDFQYSIPRLGIPHQTGYPLYALLGKLFTLIVPLNDPAYRLNLFTALNAACAVAFVYLVARHLVAYRVAALIAALTFAVGQTFWENAVVAEIYTMQMLIAALALYLAVIWRDEFTRGNRANARRRLYALAFVMGLGLAHHRLLLLIYPAIALYVLLVDRAIIRDPNRVARAAMFFLAPLLLYLYLPLRGAVGSADGAYENTLAGFMDWITARQYTVFLAQNPFQIERDATYYWTLFQEQFTLGGLALAGIGVVWLARKPREWSLLACAFGAVAAFALNYHVADAQVFFLLTFLLFTLYIGAGIDALLTLISNFQFPGSNFDFLPSAFRFLFSIFLLVLPLLLLFTNYHANDLSTKWDVHDYALDVLNQPLESNATVVGILGEMTLLRYFQTTRDIRPDVQTIAADKEDARRAAIDHALEQKRVVYLTRPLPGIAEKYSLTSLGPLIRVQPQPAASPPKITRRLDDDFGVVILLGYDLDTTRLEAIPDVWHAQNGRVLRVTLYWQANVKIEKDVMVSVKVARRDQRTVGQVDHRPVRDAYPTNTWRVGEVIADTYDVPLSPGVTPSTYSINITAYDAKSNAVIGQRTLEPLTLGPDKIAPQRAAWNIAHQMDADFGALSLVGYSLDSTERVTVRPGDALPLTLLWRAGASKLPDNLVARWWLEDARGKAVATRDTLISVGYPPFEWQANTYVRDWPRVRVPANVADGTYAIKLAVARNNDLLGSALAPFRDTVAELGQIEIKNRARVMDAPPLAHPFEIVFDQKIKLLGYDLTLDAQRHARLVLHWRALGVMDTAYTVFAHLLDAKNNVIASGDAEPGNGALPTTGWIENEYIADAHAFAVPRDLPAGAYQIEIGWYDPITGARLKTSSGQDRVILETITIR